MRTGPPAVIAFAAATLLAFCGAPPRLLGQEAPLAVAEGVELGLLYGAPLTRSLVVRPFVATDRSDERALETEAGRVEAIILRDLDLSDRFLVRRALEVHGAPPLDYSVWDVLGVDFVVSGFLEAGQEGSNLRLGVYDVVFGAPLQVAVFPLPPSSSASFRLAVHLVSDAIVTWITKEPGMAASRIVFARARGDRGYDIVSVDSDGEGEGRLARHAGIALSPTWSPGGARIAYTAMTEEATYDIVELDVGDGRSRTFAPRRGLVMTPAWSSDGSRLAVAISEGSREDLHEFDPVSGLLRLVERSAMEPSYAPDGLRLAFSSDRLGPSQVWVTVLPGSDPVLVSPWEARNRSSYHAPDWSPDGRSIAFHGGGVLHFQILVADANGRREPRQITWEGWSESPSWAPDARHLVVHGSREGRDGLYVLDAVTGRTRLLVAGSGVRTPDWSPGLGG